MPDGAHGDEGLKDHREAGAALAALLHGEEIYRTIFENSPLGVFQSTFDGRFLNVNHALATILGYDSPEELLASITDIASQIYVEPAERQVIVAQNVLAPDVTHHVNRYRRKDGSIFVANLYLKTLRDATGKPERFVGIVEDISSRLRLENELLEEKEALRVTLKSIGDGVIRTDLEGRIVLMNREAERLTGWKQVEAHGLHINDVLKIVDAITREPYANLAERVLATQGAIEISSQALLINRYGEETRIGDSCAPVFDAESKVVGVVVVFRDVTAQLRIEEQLRQSDRLDALNVLAGGIAHDLNNMSAVIMGNVSYALSTVDPNSKIFSVLQQINGGAESTKDLAYQLLNLSKGGTFTKSTEDMNELIRETSGFVLRGSKSTCQYRLQKDLWKCDVDRGQLEQVVCNTILNADQSMPDGGVITISSDNVEIHTEEKAILPAGRYVHLTLEDNGIGIPEQNLTRIFDPFFTTKKTGSGLGMATVYSIIKRHGGHIEIASVVNEGSVVHIYLPASEKQTVTRRETNQTPHKGSGRVLVMDDNEMVLGMVKRLLEHMGYEPVCVRDGRDAVDAYRQAMEKGNPFKFLLLDLTIPGGMGGEKTMLALRELDPNAKAIVSSGHSSDPIMTSYAEHGFCAAIAKPYTLAQLSQVLNQVLSP